MKKLDTEFKRAEDSPGFMLWKASNLLQRLHADCLKDLNVTPTQFSFMTCLVFLNQRGLVTPTDIVGFTGMDKMMVSDLIKTLVKKKLVVKKNNPDDGRSFFVAPTESGTQITNSAIKKIEAFDREFFRHVRDLKNFHADLISLVDFENQYKKQKS